MEQQFVIPAHKEPEYPAYSSAYFQSVKRNILIEQRAIGNGNALDPRLSVDLISNISSIEEAKRYKTGCLISISKEFSFAAAHALPFHKGKCRFLHGHEWKLRVTLKGPVNNEGMVMDFSVLQKAVTCSVIDRLDHSLVNGLIHNPTAENMCFYIWNALQYDVGLKAISKIELWETPTSKATLLAEDMSIKVRGMWDWYVRNDT